MTTARRAAVTTQVYRVYIKATPRRSGTRSRSPSGPSGTATGPGRVRPAPGRRLPGAPARRCRDGLAGGRRRRRGDRGRPAAEARPDVADDGPRSWRGKGSRASPGTSRGGRRLTRLTVTHEHEGAAQDAAPGGKQGWAGGGGGWSWMLSDLKTLLETGKALEQSDTESCAAAEAFSVWNDVLLPAAQAGTWHRGALVGLQRRVTEGTPKPARRAAEALAPRAGGPPATVWRNDAAGFADVASDRLGNSVATIGTKGSPAPPGEPHRRDRACGHARRRTRLPRAADDRRLAGGGRLAADRDRRDQAGRYTASSRASTSPSATRARGTSLDGRAGGTSTSTSVPDRGGGGQPGRPATRRRSWARPSNCCPVGSPRALDNRVGATSCSRRRGGSQIAATLLAGLLRWRQSRRRPGPGARAAAFGLEPDVAVVVDITEATDVPGANLQENGHRRLGSGPAITAGRWSPPASSTLARRGQR